MMTQPRAVLATALALAALAAAWAWELRDVLFAGRTFVSADEQAVQAAGPLLRAAASGELPHWVGHFFTGMPTLGSLTITPGVYLLENAWLAAGGKWPLFLYLHLLLASLGTYVLARAWGLGRGPALLAGLVFGLNPTLVAMIAFGHGSKLMSIAWLPLALWATWRLARAPGLLGVALTAATLGFSLQARHVQMSYYVLACAGALAALHVGAALRAREPARAGRIAAGFGLALALAALLAASLYLPVLEYAPYSIRGAPSVAAEVAGDDPAHAGGTAAAGDEVPRYVTEWSQPPLELATYALPSLFGFGGATYRGALPFTDFPHYLGVIPLGLALWALARRRRGAWALAGAAAFPALVALGHHLPALYGALYHTLPYFDAFRAPSSLLVLTELALALLAALGLDAWLGRRDPGRLPAWCAWGALAGAIAWLAFEWRAPAWVAAAAPEAWVRATGPEAVRELSQRWLADLLADARSAAGVGVAALGLLAVSLRAPRLRPVAVAGLLLLAAFDLARVGDRIGYRVAADDAPRSGAGSGDLARLLRERLDGGRIFPARELFGQTHWAVYGIDSVGGYHAAKPRAFQDLIEASGLADRFLDKYYRPRPDGGFELRPAGAVDARARERHLRLLDRLGARFVLSRHPIDEPAFRLRARPAPAAAGARGPWVYENPGALPRPHLVGGARVESDPAAALRALLAPDYEPRAHVVLDAPPAHAPAPDPDARVETLAAETNRWLLRVSSRTPQLLVWAESWYPPGWSARVDGAPARLHRADFALQAVSLPAGTHEVELRVDSPGRARGERLTAVGALLVLATGAVGALRVRSRGA
ncbi:MAG: hypothetical protein QNK03_25640 [Myxococcota bacterium]|nr:hypothetical protein [Myxococcota bacterium]